MLHGDADAKARADGYGDSQAQADGETNCDT